MIRTVTIETEESQIEFTGEYNNGEDGDVRSFETYKAIYKDMDIKAVLIELGSLWDFEEQILNKII